MATGAESSGLQFPPPPPRLQSEQVEGGTTASLTVQELAEQLRKLQLSVSQEQETRRNLEAELHQMQQQSSQASNPTTGEEQADLFRGIQDAISQGLNQHGMRQNDDRRLHDRVRTLTSLISSSPKYDGAGNVTLWIKRVKEYLRRRQVEDP